MGKMKTAVLAVAACLLVAGSLRAQTATGSVRWMGVNGAWGSYNTAGSGGAEWNVYTSPYRAAFELASNPSPTLLPPAGTGGFGPTTDIFCVDFNHYANTGTNGAFFTNLGDAQAHAGWLGTYTRIGSLQTYLAAAYLAEQLNANPSQSGILNGAIWQIMSGRPNYWWNGTNWESVAATASYAVNTGWQNVNASTGVVVTDGARGENGGAVLGNSQEYLSRVALAPGRSPDELTQVAPEPATLLLLSTGLIVMLVAAGAFRRPTV